MIESEQLRAFICIELPQELKTMLRKFQADLRLPRHDFVKWVNPDSVHLTLKFLGNTDNRKLESVKNELDQLVKNRPIFSLHTAETGYFPDLKRVRVYWLGLAGEIDKANDLHSAIDSSLVKLGFPNEQHPFAAHLTLARIKDGCTFNDRWEFVDLIKYARFDPEYSFEINRIILMRSQLTPGGATYTRLSEFIFS